MITNNNDILLASGTSIAIPQTLLLGLSAGICATLLSLGISIFCYGLWIVKWKRMKKKKKFFIALLC